MRHRTYGGKVRYLGDKVGERGREWFTVTVHGDGTRTMRVHCEMDDKEVLRDVTYTVDGNWAPRDAFVRLTVEDKFMGSGWFRFTDRFVECETLTAAGGRMSQRVDIDAPLKSFGPHPVLSDMWHLSGFDFDSADNTQYWPNAVSSPLPNGASGPMISIGMIGAERLEPEEINVPAGTFQCEHFKFILIDKPSEELWFTRDDLQLVRVRWDLLETTYELTEFHDSAA
jgi:hypothetical protein